MWRQLSRNLDVRPLRLAGVVTPVTVLLSCALSDCIARWPSSPAVLLILGSVGEHGEVRLATAEGIIVIGCSHNAGSIEMMFCSRPSESGQERFVSMS
jgi:hypothetical protein